MAPFGYRLYLRLLIFRGTKTGTLVLGTTHLIFHFPVKIHSNSFHVLFIPSSLMEFLCNLHFHFIFLFHLILHDGTLNLKPNPIVGSVSFFMRFSVWFSSIYLNPQPLIPNLKSQTLNPKSQPLKSYILNPKPWILPPLTNSWIITIRWLYLI